MPLFIFFLFSSFQEKEKPLFSESRSLYKKENNSSFSNETINEIKFLDNRKNIINTKGENIEIFKEKKEEKKNFQTADEVINAFFFKEKLEFDSELFEYLKGHFPHHYLQDVMTLEQLKVHQTLLSEMREIFNIINKKYEGRDLLIEESHSKRSEYAIIVEKYLPKMVNILNQEQQSDVAKNMRKGYFENSRRRKDLGLPIIDDALLNYEYAKKELLKNKK
jgi:hypothetical protein